MDYYARGQIADGANGPSFTQAIDLTGKLRADRSLDWTPPKGTWRVLRIGSRADSGRFLYDYRRTLADLMASEHYGTIAQVAHAAGLKVDGEALEDKRPSIGDDMTVRSHADVPMSALWSYARAGGPSASYLADMNGVASVALIYGQNLVAAESMTSAVSY